MVTNEKFGCATGREIGVIKAMPIDLQATYRSFSPPLQADKRIRARLAALERLNPNIKSCTLTAEKSPDHQLRGAPYRIAVSLIQEDGRIFADHDHSHNKSDEDFFIALDDAFDALEKILKSGPGTRSGCLK